MAETLAAWMALDNRMEKASVPASGWTPAAILFCQWKEGDDAVFDQLVEALHPISYRVAFRLLGNREDADDAVQDMFLRFYRGGKSIRNPAGLEAWIYRSTVNAVRSRQARSAYRVESVDAEVALTTASKEAGAEKTLLLRDAVQRALQTLSPKEREVLVLRDIEGLETSEVAAAMRVFEVTVRTHLCRARLRLRQELIAQGIHP